VAIDLSALDPLKKIVESIKRAIPGTRNKVYIETLMIRIKDRSTYEEGTFLSYVATANTKSAVANTKFGYPRKLSIRISR
jgi:hypothetical protein